MRISSINILQLNSENVNLPEDGQKLERERFTHLSGHLTLMTSIAAPQKPARVVTMSRGRRAHGHRLFYFFDVPQVSWLTPRCPSG